MNLKSIYSSGALLLAVAGSGSSRRLPEYTLRRRGDIELGKKEQSGRQLTNDQELRARSTAYRSCGKSGGSYGKAGGKDGGSYGKAGKDGRRELYDDCLEYGNPSDDPEYYAPVDPPIFDDNSQGLTGDDIGPTETPIAAPPVSSTISPLAATQVPDMPPVLAPVVTSSPSLGPSPSPPSRVRGESGSNQSMDVDTDYDRYVPSGSNDRIDTEDAVTVRGDGSPGSFISFPGSNTIDMGDGVPEVVPSNDDPSKDEGAM